MKIYYYQPHITLQIFCFVVHSEKWEHLTIKTKLKIDDSFCMFSIQPEAKHFENENFIPKLISSLL